MSQNTQGNEEEVQDILVDSEGTPESDNTPLEGQGAQAPQVAPRLNWPPWSQLNEDQRNWVRANPEALRYYQLVAQQERANGGGNGEGDMDVDEMLMTLPTVRDGEAFAAKHMPDLGQEVDDFQVQTWRIENWNQQGKRLQGPEFSCGGHKWRILLFPQGNANGQPNDMVSVYLDYANPKTAPEGWHACAQFALAISNPNDPSIYTVSHAHHRFVAEECDWGFTRFADLRKLHLPTDGRGRPTIEGDEVEVTAFVRVLKDPTGVLWHNFVNYDSKKETGFVGLKNQGATCYMNSLLQSLFCTPYFRRAVYQIPTETDTPSESLPLALQRVFYHL